MYIKSARITNIRSIEDFEINFEEPAGWHVLIGDNGSGKSTIIRSIALALVGDDEIAGLRANWEDWLNKKKDFGQIRLELLVSKYDLDYTSSKTHTYNEIEHSEIDTGIDFSRTDSRGISSIVRLYSSTTLRMAPNEGWFSAAYGPYRRFTGGNPEWSKVFANQPRLAAHLSVFSEDVALTEPITWLIKLNYQELERKSKFFDEVSHDTDSVDLNSPKISVIKPRYSYSVKEEYWEMTSVISCLKKLINSPEFLPNNTTIESISSEGILFRDGNGILITINQLSDGYRSILSLTLELVRQLIRVYNEEAVFKNIRENKMNIDLSGVVLIDEIDAHLHPTWQTKIGKWFLKYFPNLQFIVTTHSPLVCRAAENGTIWKLAAPGSGEVSEQITGIDRERLIYGNVLDAYGTEEFGIVDNIEAVHKKEELVRLSKKQLAGKISPEEENKLHKLRAIFSTDATIEL